MFKEIGYFSKVENLDIERIGREIIIEDVSDFVIVKVRVVIYVIFGDILSWLLLFFRNLREKKLLWDVLLFGI